MADQGDSYRRGPVESNYSRAQPTGLPTKAESYKVSSLLGDPVQGNLNGSQFMDTEYLSGTSVLGSTNTATELITLIRSQ